MKEIKEKHHTVISLILFSLAVQKHVIYLILMFTELLRKRNIAQYGLVLMSNQSLADLQYERTLVCVILLKYVRYFLS